MAKKLRVSRDVKRLPGGRKAGGRKAVHYVKEINEGRSSLDIYCITVLHFRLEFSYSTYLLPYDLRLTRRSTDLLA